MGLFNFFRSKNFSEPQPSDLDFRVALMSNNELFRKGFTYMLNHYYTVLFSVNYSDLLMTNLNDSNLPDFVLIDIDNNLESAISTCDWLTGKYPIIKVVVLTIDSLREPVDEMIEHGACGFFLKTSSPEEIRTGFQAIRKKGHYLQTPLEQLRRTELSDKALKRFAKQFGINLD